MSVVLLELRTFSLSTGAIWSQTQDKSFLPAGDDDEAG